MSNDGRATALGTSVALVLEAIKSVTELRRAARSKQLLFATDVCLVAYGVRSGYLVDALCPPNPIDTFCILLIALRGKSAIFNDIVIWHHTPTAQSFLVHVPRLRERITALLDGATRECVFVKLDKYLSASGRPPDPVRISLYEMGHAMAESPDALVFSLSQLFTEEILIPLAAVMIDYPVAYFPAFSTQALFLEGEPLDVYTVSFKWTINASDFPLGFANEHVLLKFSCPQVLASGDAELSPNVVINKLHARFATHLQHLGASILVGHRAETLERVAL